MMTHVQTHSQQDAALIEGNYRGKDIVSLSQFTAQDLAPLFALTQEMKYRVQNSEPVYTLAGKLVGLLFFEASSRTFGSFAAAVKRLGGQTLEMQNPAVSSVSKGETFEDTIRVFEAYTDALVVRSPLAGAAQLAAQAAELVPVLNAGDGNNEHPTQTLLDLYTLRERFGRLDHLSGLLVGDPLNSRTLHSLIMGLSLFPNNTVYLLSPDRLRLRREDFIRLSATGVKIIELSRVEDIPRTCDFWYWTRIQRERLASQEEYERVAQQTFVATPELLARYASKDMILMDPLPRVGSMDPALDGDERSVYLRSQIRNGLYTRMALLSLVLGKV